MRSRPGCAPNSRRAARTCRPRSRALCQQVHRTGAQGTLAFYKTPLGKKLIDKNPRRSMKPPSGSTNGSNKYAEEVMVRIAPK